MKSISIDEFIDRCRQVTNNYVLSDYRWTIKDQFNKIDEEVNEFKEADTSLNQLEEGWDVIFSTITQFHKMGFDDYAIKESMLSTLKKIERRSNNALDKSRSIKSRRQK